MGNPVDDNERPANPEEAAPINPPGNTVLLILPFHYPILTLVESVF